MPLNIGTARMNAGSTLNVGSAKRDQTSAIQTSALRTSPIQTNAMQTNVIRKVRSDII
ncbi:MAG: hypothetical protein AB8B99_01210 [Phormidesmis sp.]